MKEPGPDHPITIEPVGGPLQAVHHGQVLARSEAVLKMQEADYPPVYYFPRADIAERRFTDSATTSYCPFKGNASYLSLWEGGEGTDIAWRYDEPYPAVREIAGHVAFYADRVKVGPVT